MFSTQTRKWSLPAGTTNRHQWHKKTMQALKELERMTKEHVSLCGVTGVDEMSSIVSQPMGDDTPEIAALIEAIGTKYEWTVCKETAAGILDEARHAISLATTLRPIEDNRRTVDQDAERLQKQAKGQEEWQERQRLAKESHAVLLAKKPAKAQALIVAEYQEDDSDTMTDYFNAKTVRVVAIGWRTGKREDFKQLRRAAATFEPTAHLGPDADKSVEHRDNYSMGSGNYVASKWRKTGTMWVVQSYSVDGLGTTVIEDQLPTSSKPATVEPAKSISGTASTIQKHHHTKHNFDFYIIVLADRLERDEFVRLRDIAKSLGGWYSRAWDSTPAGFAFKDEAVAKQFVADHLTGDSEPDPEGDRTAPGRSDKRLVGKFNQMADKLQGVIDKGRAERQSNTPKRYGQMMHARMEADRSERVQQALRALAALHEAGECPAVLATISNKKALYDLLNQETESQPNGHHSYSVETGTYRDTSEQGRAVQALIGGSALSDEERELQKLLADVQFSNIAGYFPTPGPVIEMMLDRADIQEGHCVLEPSAGRGDIADACKDAGAVVTCCEVSPTLGRILSLKDHKVVGGDFIERFSLFDPKDGVGEVSSEMKQFDCVVMNPPFEKMQDADHVQHAYKLLKDGGRLVAIMSPSPFFRSDKRAQSFRDWFDELGGECIELPEGSFKASGTGVSTRLVIIDK